MLKFKPAFSSDHECSSPSLTMEKGTYRMRAPTSRPAIKPLRLSDPPRPAARPRGRNENDRLLIQLGALLLFACISCFGAAYYLFTTRWDAAVIQPRPQAHNPFQVATTDDRYLAYLPHSGFHNQRIAFENALVLARLTNRTLIVPPVRLGNKPQSYLRFYGLRQALALSGKEGLDYCPNLPPHIILPPECLDYFDYTHISWDWLVNLTSVQAHQSLVDRWDMSDSWLQDKLGITESETLLFRDSEPYEFRFMDTTARSTSKYKRDVYIPALAESSQRLIQIGTLFGSSRLRLRKRHSLSLRSFIRQSMSFTNPLLDRVADSIQTSLSANNSANVYLAAHLRLGDGKFRQHRMENARQVWWKLVHEVLNFSVEETTMLESDMMTFNPISGLEPSLPFQFSSSHVRCHSALHTQPRWSILNVPLFVSTDAPNPRKDHSLELFLRTFPCTVFLQDFVHQTRILDEIGNEADGVKMRDFLLPFLDAMVAGKAWRVAGTQGSTFSAFVEDVLWPSYHGKHIVSRG
ncbi:hypothetical protein C8J56DRAFT_1122814 [Mycena floridula]|nr:hypothetical protein C8J56DRAFT_1122814 [Mycena floridula]